MTNIRCSDCEGSFQMDKKNTKIYAFINNKIIALVTKCPNCERKTLGIIGWPKESYISKRLQSIINRFKKLKKVN